MPMKLEPGTRVRFNRRSPWVARVGCLGTVVAGPDRYPFNQLGQWEVVVLLDDDPIRPPEPADQWDVAWSCIAKIDTLEIEASEGVNQCP